MTHEDLETEYVGGETFEKSRPRTRRFGDFRVPADELAEAEDVHDDRNPVAAAVDERLRAPITTDVDLWSSNPGYFDYPSVDTPTDTPRRRAEDQMQETVTADKERERKRQRGDPIPSPPESPLDMFAMDKFVDDLESLATIGMDTGGGGESPPPMANLEDDL